MGYLYLGTIRQSGYIDTRRHYLLLSLRQGYKLEERVKWD
jgi:hypothetical protein